VNANGDADANVMSNGLDVAPVSDPDEAERVRPVPAVSTFNPLNVATPFTAFTVAVPANVPALRVSEIESLDVVVTVFPNASWTVTTGCVANAVPATVEEDGCVVNANFDADANVMSKALDVAEVKEPDAADNVRPVPAVSTFKPLNVATPLTALTVAVPAKVPALTATVTDAVESVTVFPNASWTVTTGCDANATPATVDADGWVVNANFDAVAKVMSNVLDVAEVREPDAADNVRPVPTVSTFKPAKVATPLTAFTVAVPANVPELRVSEIESLVVETVLP